MTAPSTRRMLTELDGIHGATGSASGASLAGVAAARATTSAVSAIAASAAIASSASASTGAAGENGTKPLFRGPRMEGVRNMKCLLVDVVGDAMCSQRRRILDKSIAPREIACVRKTTRARRRANARGFVHEAVLQRR